MDNYIHKNDRIDNLQKTLDRLYKCRDLEISNLWQRSIFLGAFLLLCFTAYGMLFGKNINNLSSLVFQLGATALSIIGYILSLIWIMMAKSSKAWVQVYETKIGRFETDFKRVLDIPNYCVMNGENLDPKDIDMYIICSRNAGAFSPSKINILLGQIFITIWVLLFIGHNAHFIKNILQSGSSSTDCELWIVALAISILCTMVVFFFISLLKRCVKSGALS
ncbi:MAG: hypothetical protein LBM63_00395 [Rikenellaceae bacterium]|jgi:hypothetical protein|nr:hypothetical protein [Rikenellaceae bacterium]